MVSRKRNKPKKLTYKLRKTGGANTTLDIVVARFSENMDWLQPLCNDLKGKGIIYNKGPALNNIHDIKIINLENIGREAHTYLYHVIQNYNNLADLTLFLPGSVKNKPFKSSQLDKIIPKLKEAPNSYIVGNKAQTNINGADKFTINNHVISNNNNRLLNPNARLNIASIRPLGPWFNKYFPNETIKCISYNGIFVVKREDIHKRTLDFYKSLLETVSTKNPEAVHYMERVWSNIYSISNCI